MTSRDSFFHQCYRAVEETGDIIFVVRNNAREFKAHKLILSILSKPLYDIAMVESKANVNADDDTDSINAVVLDDTDENTFRVILESIYTGKMQTQLATVEEGKHIIVACDKFGCIDLKLNVEEMLTEKYTISNAMDLLLFAEAHTCPILKEKVMNKYRLSPKDVMEANKEDWCQIEQSPKLLSDLLWYTNIDRPNRKDYTGFNHPDDYEHFKSSDLIKVLKN